MDLEVERAQQPVVATARALGGGSFRDGGARRIELLIVARRDATCDQRLGPGDPALSPRGAELLDLRQVGRLGQRQGLDIGDGYAVDRGLHQAPGHNWADALDERQRRRPAVQPCRHHPRQRF